jgi:GT2 family glycosyltransferase
MVNKIDLSIIILSHNTSRLLRECLESVRQAMKNNLVSELIVVDNDSTDDSVGMVKRDFPEAIVIGSPKNLGYAGGNNLGIKKARGKFILFLNSDTQIFQESLIKMVKFMEENPQVGASTPKTMLFSGKMDPDCHRGFPTPWGSICYFLGLEKLFPKSRIFGQYHKFYLDLNKNHEIDAGFGTFMIVRKAVLDRVGVWDDNYFFYGEDLDLFYRIKKAGWKVMFYHEPLVKHHKGASSGLRKESKNVTKATRQTRLEVAGASIKAMEIFYKKFYKNKYPFWATWLVILGIKIRGSFRILFHYLKK